MNFNISTTIYECYLGPELAKQKRAVRSYMIINETTQPAINILKNSEIKDYEFVSIKSGK